MKYLTLLLAILIASCSTSETRSHIEGTWKLLGAKTITGSEVEETPMKQEEMIKIINESHFSFLRHDLDGGQDSLTANFVAGGGRYVYANGQYKEYLDYCTARGWEGHQFEFEVVISGDTLIQTGVEKIESLGVDRKIVERYLRVK